MMKFGDEEYQAQVQLAKLADCGYNFSLLVADAEVKRLYKILKEYKKRYGKLNHLEYEEGDECSQTPRK